MVPHTQPAGGAHQPDETQHIGAFETLRHRAVGIDAAAPVGHSTVFSDAACRHAQGTAGGTGGWHQGRLASAGQLRASGLGVCEEEL